MLEKNRIVKERGKFLVHKILYPILILIICTLVALVVYLNHQDTQNEYHYLKLSGESPHWKLTDYRVEITPNNMKSGNGKLYFKSTNNNYVAEYYDFSMRAIVNNEETTLQKQVVSGPEDFKNGVNTGSIEGPAYITKTRNPITLEDVDEIYAVIQWENDRGKTQKETISLYMK